MKKSQAAIELLVFVSVAVFLLIVYTAISSHYLNVLEQKEIKMNGADILNKFISEFNTAGRVENGYSRTIEVPKQIEGREYELYFGRVKLWDDVVGDEREIVVYYDKQEYVARLSVNIEEDNSQETQCYELPSEDCTEIFEPSEICEWEDNICKIIPGEYVNSGGNLTIKKENNHIIWSYEE